jgi:hypothetical protein
MLLFLKNYHLETNSLCSYERVVKRVLENPIKAHRLVAEQILGCVVSAERPLRWREIQSRFCIDTEAGIANLERKSVQSCKYLCGSLVEVGMMEAMSDPESDGEVEMVHSSAKAYVSRVHILSWKVPFHFHYVSTRHFPRH